MRPSPCGYGRIANCTQLRHDAARHATSSIFGHVGSVGRAAFGSAVGRHLMCQRPERGGATRHRADELHDQQRITQRDIYELEYWYIEQRYVERARCHGSNVNELRSHFRPAHDPAEHIGVQCVQCVRRNRPDERCAADDAKRREPEHHRRRVDDRRNDLGTNR